MKIVLIGYGAMGQLIARLAEQKGHEVHAVIDEDEAATTAAALAEKLTGADVAIDFTVGGAVRRNVEACLAAGVPLVEGTTGWDEHREAIKEQVTERGGAMVYGANFSLGVNLFYRIAGYAAELMAAVPGYEAFIEEQHHSRKKDAPSGTALKVLQIVQEAMDREIGVTSTRAGSIPGTHRVGFDGPADQILLEHSARSREGFASGALMAAEWIVGRTGFYEFTDVIDEVLNGRPTGR